MKNKDKVKKEKTYWNVKESDIDKTLLAKIKKNTLILNTTVLIFVPCSLINAILQLCSKYINKTALLVLSIIFIVICLAVIVIELLTTRNLLRLKKEVKKIQEAQKTEEETISQ